MAVDDASAGDPAATGGGAVAVGSGPGDLGSEGRSTPTAAGIWFGVLATVLSGVAPALFIRASERVQDVTSTWTWAVVLIVAVGLRLAWLIANDPRRMFEIVFWLFTYVFMGLAALVQIRTDNYPETTKFIDQALHPATFVVLGVGCVAFLVGAVLAGGSKHLHPGDVLTRVSPHRVTILTALALLATTYYVAKLGLGTLFASRAERTATEALLWPNFTISAIVRAAGTLPLVVSFAALLRLRRERRMVGGVGPSVLPWLVLAVLIVVVNPISSPRYVVGTAALAVLASFGAAATDRRARLFMVALVVGLVFVFPNADFARNPDQEVTTTGPAAALSTADFDAYDQINNAIAYVDSEGHTRGRQLFGAALFWVPRAGWPDKPTNTGEVLADFRDYDYANLSAPVWSELWIDGGWPLLVGGMGLLGWVLRRSDERAKAQPRQLRPGVLVGILPFYLIIVLRGSLLQAMAGMTVLVVSGLFVTTRAGPVTTRT